MNTITHKNKELSPVDSKAGRVASKGFEYIPEYDAGICWDKRPQTVPVPPNMKNLIGTQRGRITIVGYLGTRGDNKNKRKRNRKWLGRCACGRFVPRKDYKWRSALQKDSFDKGCQHCNHIDQITRRAEYASIGKNVNR